MKSFQLFFIILISILFISSAKSQWLPCQGIEGAYTTDIMTYDSELFIITSGNGIFKRSISQTAWDSACLAGGFLKIWATENVLYCFGPMTYFYRSMDNGASWIFDEEYSWVYDMDVADSVDFIINNGIVMRSLNEGDSWMSVYPDPNSSGMNNIYTQSGHVFCSDYYADNIGLESLAIHCGYPQGDTIFLATGSGPFYKIAGSYWISDYDELFQLNVKQVFIRGSRMYANVQESLYYSDDITDDFSVLPIYCLGVAR